MNKVREAIGKQESTKIFSCLDQRHHSGLCYAIPSDLQNFALDTNSFKEGALVSWQVSGLSK